MQYLYLIECQEYCKIGIANDVQNRLAQLSTGNPFPLRVLAVWGFDNANAVETALHQRYSEKCKRGEWFFLSAADVDIIKQICGLLGGVPTDLPTDVAEEEVEIAEALAEPTDGAKWDFAAMFADGWRMEPADSHGVKGQYWCWRKGGESVGRKYIYGGTVRSLPYPIPDMRLIYRDGEQPFNPPNKPLAESVGNEK